MARCCLSAGLGPGRDARTRVIALCLTLFPCTAALAQGASDAVLHLPSPLRLSVAANVARACGATPAGAEIQTQSETQLRGAGFMVSNIYNGRLTFDVDCVSVRQNAGLAVHQCLDFSQVVAADSGVGNRTFATTWRQCRSYTCRGTKCAASAQTGVTSLIEEFLHASMQREMQAGNRGGPIQPPASTAPKPSASAAAAVPQTSGIGHSTTMRTAFYSLYVLICCVELLYWALRKKAW